MSELVKITEEEFGVILDLRYASTNNVCEQKLYNEPTCYLARKAIEPFKKAILSAKNLGYKIKIWDSFRPLEVQNLMYNKFPSNDSTGGFVSSPKTGSTPHCRGIALDLTLCDLGGNEIEMGTDFDNFTSLAFHRCHEVSNLAQKNRLILLGIMTLAGFDFYAQEWWHYQFFNPREYPIIPSPKGFSAV